MLWHPRLAVVKRCQNNGRGGTGRWAVASGLACGGCSIRLFTTVQLTSGDPLLLAGYGLGLALDAAVLAQIFYYGAGVQGQPLAALMTADFRSDDAAVKESGADVARR